MQIQQVRAFLAAGRTGGFGRAGISLGVTQPSISTAIRKLEDELGVQLFERLGRRIRLTAAGQALFEAAAPVLQQWEQLPAMLNDVCAGELEGPVRIGIGIFTAPRLPRVFRLWRMRYPNVRVIVQTQSARETFELLRTGDLDLGWRAVSSVPAEIFFKPLETFGRVVISAHRDALTRVKTLTLAELARHRFVNARGPSPMWLEIERVFRAANLHCHVVLEAGGLDVLKRYVGLGLGLAVIPACCVEPKDRARLAVRSVRHLFGQDAFGILVRRGRPLSRAAHEFVRLVDAEFPPQVP